MKTIAQIAQKLGVTKPGVRRYLTDDMRKQFTETISGVIYISEQGEELIKSKFLKSKAETERENVSGNESETISALISMLQSELEAKNRQLEAKDKQIEELTATIKIQAESISTANKNELAETIIEGQGQLAPKKKGIFSKLFSRGKRQ